jgi:hypothetical protein
VAAAVIGFPVLRCAVVFAQISATDGRISADARALAQDWTVTSQLLLTSVKCDFSHSGRPTSVSSLLTLRSH